MKKLSIVFTCCAFLLLSANLEAQNWGKKKNTISGEGPTVTQTFTLDDFHSLGLSISGDVIIKKGKSN